jgi:hypothetical protein
VLEEAGGWRRVLERFESDAAAFMDRYPNRFMVLLIDFDGNDGRLDDARKFPSASERGSSSLAPGPSRRTLRKPASAYTRRSDRQWPRIAAKKPTRFGGTPS